MLRSYKIHDWQAHLRYELSPDKEHALPLNSCDRLLNYQTDHLANQHLPLKLKSAHEDIADKSCLNLAY